MSAHRMADKCPACIQYTAQYVHHDMSQLHKELYARVEEDITSVLKIIFNFVKPPQISCFNFSGIKIGNFLCRFLFPHDSQAMYMVSTKSPLVLKWVSFATSIHDDKMTK